MEPVADEMNTITTSRQAPAANTIRNLIMYILWAKIDDI